MQHVFIVGAKSMGAYGGYETFVYKLTQSHQNYSSIQYHVACKANGDGSMQAEQLAATTSISKAEFLMHGARCFRIRVPNIGPAAAIYYDVAALEQCCKYIQTHRIPNPIVYILACRIGPFMKHFVKRIHALGG